MKNLNSLAFSKLKKRNNILFIICIITLVLTFLFISLGYIKEKKISYVDINKISKNNKYEIDVSLKINIKPTMFAVYTKNGKEDRNKFYFVMDSNNKLYIVYMNDNLYNQINKNMTNQSYLIKGKTKKISLAIKKLAISSYNQLMKDEYLTDDNFSDYVGDLYIDTTFNFNNNLIYYLIAFILSLIFLILFGSYINVFVFNKKVLSKLDKNKLARIDANLQEVAYQQYNDLNLYLLKDSLVSLNYKIIIIDYKNIIASFMLEYKSNFILDKYIKVIDKNNKNYKIASINKIDNKEDKILTEIINLLRKKNKNIIIDLNLFKEKVKIKNKKNQKVKIKRVKNK